MNTDPMVIRINDALLSFPSLHQKSAMKGKDVEKEGSFKASFLLHKTRNAKTIAAIRAAFATLEKEEFGGKKLELAPAELQVVENPPDRPQRRDLRNQRITLGDQRGLVGEQGG